MSSTPSKAVRYRIAGACLLVATIVGCGSSDDVEESVDEAVDAAEQSVDEAEEASSAIAEVLRENGLESIASAVQDIDFAELADSEEFTFFAPNDEAFQTLSSDEVADLLSFDGRLEETLRNHIVDERIDAAELAEVTSIETTGGMTLPVSVDGDTISVSGAIVVEADVEVDDGVVHIVDGLFIEE